MFKRGKMLLLSAGVLAAASLGGSALAAAGTAHVTPVIRHSGTAHARGAATGPTGTGMETGNEAPGTETADGQQGPDTETQDGQQGPDTEMADGSSESAGSEVPGNDGPGGHADEPGNPNAQNQE